MLKSLRACGVALWLVAPALLAPAASAQTAASTEMDSREAIELQHQLQELRHEMQTLRDQAGRAPAGGSGGSSLGGRGSSDSAGNGEITGQLLSRMEALEDQVRRLRGRVDEVANQTQRQGDELGKQIGDLNFRLQALEQGNGGASRAPVPPTGGPSSAPSAALPPPMPVRRTPEVTLQEGSAALARRDYVAAEAAAREVLTNNKTSPRAYDAQLLLAQALSGRKEFSQAAIAYDDAYKRNRKGARAPEALLGLANSLTAIGERRAACDTVGQLHGEFPSPRPELKAQIAASAQRAGCK